MTKRVGLLVLLAACSSRSSAPPGEPEGPAEEPAAVAPGPAPCAVAETSPSEVALPRELAAVGPQYFHASTRDGFNYLPDGGRVYTWFDAYDLSLAVTPPKGMSIIERSTGGWLLGRSADGSPRYARRGDAASKPLPNANMRLIDVVETEAGEVWAIGQRVGALSVLHVAADGAVTPRALDDASVSGRDDARLVDVGGGKVAALWVSRSGSTLRVHLAWPGVGPAVTRVDEVTLSAPAAELSSITGFDLAAARHADGVAAVAWRPLIDPPAGTTLDVGSRSEPPQTPAAAEVRVLLVDAEGLEGVVERHPTTAAPLGGTTGVGPWPLNGNGMAAGHTAEGAVVLWLESSGDLVGVRPGATAVSKLRASAGWPRLELMPGGKLLTFDSASGVRRSNIVCAP